MTAPEAVEDILEIRNSIKPEDCVTSAGKVSFSGSGRGEIVVGGDKFSLLDSGEKSLCGLLQIPQHILKDLSPITLAGLLGDLFKAKFAPHDFLTIRYANVGNEKKIRAVISSPQKVLNDGEVFSAILPLLVNLSVECFWVDDYATAVRFINNRARETVVGGTTLEIRTGMDIVNSEVRERGLEIRGVLWVNGASMIAPKLIYPAYKGKSSHPADIRSLLSFVGNFAGRLSVGMFDEGIIGALKGLADVNISLGWELKNFFKRDVFSGLDVLKFLEFSTGRADPRWRDKDPYALCDMSKNTLVPALTFMNNLSRFAAGFDTYNKRSSLEFGLNLLF
jgi:hypothetical protein